MKKRLLGALLTACVTLSLLGCRDTQQPTQTTAPAAEDSSQTETNQLSDTGFQAAEKFEVTFEELSDFLDARVEACLTDDEITTCQITVTGLCTPVVLEMEGQEIPRLLAYDRVLEVNASVVEGYCELYLLQYQDMLIVNKENESWLMTREQDHHFPCMDNVRTILCVNDQGQLTYIKSALNADTLSQWITAPLDCATDRGNFFDESGVVQMQDGEPVLVMEQRNLIGHVYDLDALFTMAKVLDWAQYDGCETADDVLRRNREKGTTWLTYPYQPKEPAQKVYVDGLTLKLPMIFEEEMQEDGTLRLYRDDLYHTDMEILVSTGDIAEDYRDIEEPVTDPYQLLQWDWTCRDAVSSTETSCVHQGVPCLIFLDDGADTAIGYYIKDNRYWQVSVSNIDTEVLLTYAACGTIE